MKRLSLSFVLLAAWLLGVHAEVDPNFYIYLCFGQSNMEGNADWESIDNQVDSRFKMLATCNFSSPSRTKGNWYTANCPIVSPAGKLGPTDYFGRTMVAALPTNVKVGVVAVAMGGSPIEMFDKDKYKQKLADNPSEWWATLSKQYYGGNPYGRLIEMAKKAQEVGVIKGILLHQGCSNNGDSNWPNMVKKIYNDMLTDLGLKANDVPIFVGETERQDMGGGCYHHNAVVAKIPTVIPTGHVVSSEALPGNGVDAWHFSAAGYRTFGKRYAAEVLKVMGLECKANPDYNMPSYLKNFFTPKSYNDHIVKKPGTTVTLKLMCTYVNGHEEQIMDAKFTSSDLTITNGKVKLGEAGTKSIVTASFTDFLGTQHEVPITLEASDALPNRVLMVNNGSAGSNPWDKQCSTKLKTAMKKGSTYVVTVQVKADNAGDFALWPIWTTSSNRDQWGNSADVQYLDGKTVKKDWTQLKWEFNASFAHDKLQFVFGKIGGRIYFDEVSCKLKGSDTEMVVNGNFEDNDLSNWEVLGYAGQSMNIMEMDNPLGISTLSMDNTFKNQNVIYDLKGRKVGTKHEWESLPSGIYIINGRKIVR